LRGTNNENNDLMELPMEVIVALTTNSRGDSFGK